MAASNREAFLPTGTADFLRRRAVELGAGVVFALALAYAAALISSSPNDPSINTATAAAPANWLGARGAMVADLSFQTVGFASALVLLVLAGWSWRLASHRGLPWAWLNIVLLPFSLVLAGIAAAGLVPLIDWVPPFAPGGFVGDVLLRRAVALGTALTVEAAPAAYGLVALAALIPAALFAVALSTAEWRMLGRGGWWLTRQFGHGLAFVLLLLGRLIPVFRRAGSAVAERRAERRAERAEKTGKADRTMTISTRRAGGRLEPTFGPAPPRSEADEAEDEEDAIAPPPAPRVEKRAPKPAPGKRARAEAQPSLNLGNDGEIALPPLALLSQPKVVKRQDLTSEDALEQNARMLESVLEDFGVRGEITKVRPGPVVTLYELEPARGTKTSRVIGLADDIARSMSSTSVRVAVIPGQNAIGIEMPNTERETVLLRELLSASDYDGTQAKLPLALGKDISGAPVVADLARMPHLLVAGTTGSGKSVAVNSMILSLLYRLRPDECKFIMIDPKMLELSVYDGIPHLLAPVVTEPGKAVVALKWVVREMENRYRAMSYLGVRNVAGYNQRLEEARKNNESLKRTVQTGFDEQTGKPVFEEQPLNLEAMPFIVVIVDEMADLMLVAGKDIESSVQRLSQMARAAGIHLIMATQRPSVDVITGTIKANFPTRISFQVTSKIDSRTILGEQGAEQLLGSGDMLYMQSGGRIVRVHGPFVSDGEVEKVVEYLREQGAPAYVEAVTEEPEGAIGSGGSEGGEGSDALYDQAVDVVCRQGKASTSFVQRHLQIGYNRAARIIERMEQEGIVSPANHVGKREILARKIPEYE